MHPARILFFISCSLALGGCTAVTVQTVTPTTPLDPSPAATLAPTMTFTPLPTKTPTPTLAPTPMGGGGMLLFSAHRSVFSGELAAPPADFNVYAAHPDGSGLTALTQESAGASNILAGPSPDGQQVLYYSTSLPGNKIYQDDKKVDLWVISLQTSQPVQLTTKDVHSYLAGATWAPDGSVYFIGWDMEGMGLFHVSADGSGLARVAKPVSPAATGKAEILFFDPDKTGLYWATGASCSSGALCGARYYRTALDGSDQQQVWKWLKGVDDHLALSPDGQWLAYQQWISQQIPESYKNGCYVASMDGSKIQQMRGKNPRCYIIPHQTDFWSPDGKSFVYLTTDGDLNKYPVHLFSPDQNTIVDLPDLQTPSCEQYHWLPNENRILFTYCRSNFGGYDSPTSNRMMDLTSGTVTAYPNTDYCEVSFSPDSRTAFMYNCHSEGVGEVKFRFYTLDLDTSTLTPLFTDVLNPTQEGAYWTLFAPSPWQAWSQ